MESTLNLKSSISSVKGVGEVKANLLNKMGIYTIKDLIEYYPRNYEDRTKIKYVREFTSGESTLFVAKICSNITVRKIRKNLAIYTAVAVDDEGERVKLTWFNQMYLKNRLIVGHKYLFFGTPVYDFGTFSVENSQIYNLSDISKIQGIYPIYSLTKGITQNYMFKLLSENYTDNIKFKEIYSEEFKKKYNLCDINFAFRNVHFPKNYDNINIARNRLIFDELFLLQIALMTVKNQVALTPNTNTYEDLDDNDFLKLLPFELTGAQKKVLAEIKEDLGSNKVMNRLIQGDVGCGKTMVAAIAMFLAVKNGYQAAIMAPTTILANQHYNELKPYFEKLGYTVEILTSNNTKAQKRKIVDRLKMGMIDILVGTHSIIEDDVEFKNLSLVITDEQHRFGVKQRMKLSSKAEVVDTLVMTATPIPRTLAIMLYGDLDLSIIDELPPGRKPVKTLVVNDSYETRLNDFVRKNVKDGKQVYVVCPLVEESEDGNLKSAEEIYESYKNETFKDLNVGLIHGKMKQSLKDEIMLQFKENKINILVSTTVIEVGISVSNATIMIIENADRFGLAALHQLRGRVGRGSDKSYCILKTNNRSQTCKERLSIMEKSNDGFKIAEKDLELRGPGDFFGIRQSGLPEFKVANLLKDINILKLTQVAAKELMQEDPKLELDKNKYIKKIIYSRYSEQLKNIGT